MFVGTVGSSSVSANFEATWADCALPEQRLSQLSQVKFFSANQPGAHLAVADKQIPYAVQSREDLLVFVMGNPSIRGKERCRGAKAVASTLAHARARQGLEMLSDLIGDFALVLFDPTGCLLAIDRFGIQNMVYSICGRGLVFGTHSDVVAPLSGQTDLDPQALFNYLYFHMIPSPRTIFKNCQRLWPGHCLMFDSISGKITDRVYWQPRYCESEQKAFADLRDEFHHLLRESVTEQCDRDRTKIGSFLSGGTDSSTIAGMLSEVQGEPANTFSIGFNATGYDESHYARIAANYFKTKHHEYYLSSADLIAGISKVAHSYDQPFGNSSVLPAYYCARIAKKRGVEKLLAGDGGDELFGGNSRYAKLRLVSFYEFIPLAVRRLTLEPLVGFAPFKYRSVLLQKLTTGIVQANTPMPARMMIMSQLAQIGYRALDPDLLRQVQTEEPQRVLEDAFEASNATTTLNKMLTLDWKITLADNDLPKVSGACALAGIEVGYPMLSLPLVEFAHRLQPDLKVKGLRLRYFFKEALRGFLPAEIISKKKHGFGLPFGIWMTQDKALSDFANDSLDSIKSRGFIRAKFIDELLASKLSIAPAYFGEFVWVMMMLEHWLQGQASARPLRKQVEKASRV